MRSTRWTRRRRSRSRSRGSPRLPRRGCCACCCSRRAAPRAGRRARASRRTAPGCASTAAPSRPALGGAGRRDRTARAASGVRGERRGASAAGPACAWSTACRSRTTSPARSAARSTAAGTPRRCARRRCVTRTYALHQRARRGAHGFDVRRRTPATRSTAASTPRAARSRARSADTRAEVLTWRRRADPRGVPLGVRRPHRERRGGLGRAAALPAQRRGRGRGGLARHLLARAVLSAPHSGALSPRSGSQLGARARGAGGRADGERPRWRVELRGRDGSGVVDGARAARRARRRRSSAARCSRSARAATTSCSSARATVTASA